MDYLPRRKSEFKNWETNFFNHLTTNQAEFGLTAEELAALANLQSSWQAAYTNHLNAQSALEICEEEDDDDEVPTGARVGISEGLIPRLSILGGYFQASKSRAFDPPRSN
ncbi:MAG: hypothetical protein GDA56_27090 [Hormoscilla sp. GM7CHS1pb]|nr:hypothetical protein [Hormoscilla sp. GM7CHS1pb]